ncbi:nuclear transport factor 2 family protein [Nonomuraea glycinis]|jgi:ketosteroid isomerase-like protein|uniref:nuclear transport factor 2 family protein n=1 Tax=Nonomuraea glycinis TaxID=2047744 RepID=UPI002E0E708E|nr:nuclear transport factor 2 family protein [Nonomuraea glycinis]
MSNTQQGTDSVRAAAQQTFRDHLDHLSSGRFAEWVDLFAEEGVLEFPYAPKGYPAQVAGKQDLLVHLKSFSENFRVEFTDLRFHETTDPSLVIAELKSEGVALETGRPYNQTYISVVETKDGKISRYVDFWNPQVAAEALGGGNDDLVSAFSND